MELIERVGAYVGLLAFLGFAVLAFLYFSQARDVRRLRDWAGHAPERMEAAAQRMEASYQESAPEPVKSGGQLESASLNELAAAIRKLPPRFREVLMLCGVEGFDYEEAATILGVPVGTVRSRLSRARALLREWSPQ